MISLAIAVTTAVAAAIATCCHIFINSFQYTRDSIYIMSSVFLHTKIAHTLCGMNFVFLAISLFTFDVRFTLVLSPPNAIHFILGRPKNRAVLHHSLTKFHELFRPVI